jgi:hypothetical protein
MELILLSIFCAIGLPLSIAFIAWWNENSGPPSGHSYR